MTGSPGGESRGLRDTPRRPEASDTRPATADQAALPAALLAQLPGLVWATDTELCCRFASASAAVHLGVVVSAPIAVSALVGATPIDVAALEAHRRALRGDTVRFEVRHGGRVLRCLVEPLRGAGDTLLGVLGSAEDVTEQRATEATLIAQHRLFETMLDHATDAIAICDAQGRFVFANQAARRWARSNTGRSSGEKTPFASGDWYEHGRHVPREDWPLDRALAGETVSGREMYVDTADGTRHYLLISAAPVRDAHGAVIGAVTTSADIDAQKAVEERMRALNEALEERVRERSAELALAKLDLEREIAEHLHAAELLERSQRILSDIVNHSAAIIYLKDVSGRYLLVNRRYEQLFRATKEEITGRTDFEIFPHDVAVSLRANDQHVLNARGTLQFEEVVPHDGKPRTYLSVKFPLRDRSGTVYGVCGISADITERKRIEAELQRSKAALAAVIESSPDPILALDRDFRLVALNTVAANAFLDLFGTSAVLGARQLDAVPAELAARWRARLERALTGERFSVAESLTIGGRARHLLVSLNPTVQDGEVTGVTVFGKDITELTRAEEQARQHQAELAHALRLHTMGEMAASLAHEVNQPLGAIANYAQGCRRRLEAGVTDPEVLLAAVKEIAHEALRAGEITRRVRELLRKEEAHRQAVDVNELVSKAANIAESTARRHGVPVSVLAGPELPRVLVDPIQIEQVVLNLLLNAVEAIATAPGPHSVSVSTRGAPNEVEVMVRDSGSGIDPSLGDRVFEPFFTTKSGGLGMGLAISRSIVVAHGGRLWATANPERGTTFRFTLPVAPPAEP